MDERDFPTALELLRKFYGGRDFDDYRHDWRGAVRFLLECEWSPTKFAKHWPELSESWLCDVEDVARCNRDELWDFLSNHDFSASLVAFVHKLAGWWRQEIEAGRPPLEFEHSFSQDDHAAEPTAWARQVARQDKSLAARIAVGVFNSSEFPMTRGVWRVGCRHEWFSWHDEPADAAGFLEAGLRQVGIDLAQGSDWLIRVAEDYCGSKPKCTSCPLLPVLGPAGPCEFSE